ncbi:MAG: MerR family transcriptional regulator [Pseudomonadota bacterium]
MDSQIGDEAEGLSPLIPEKKYFRIGEVCEIAGVKQHVLRYWESEFKQLIRPHRASSKQRLYRQVDVENILRIKKLLKEDGFTIPGAKKLLIQQKKESVVEGVKVMSRPDVRSFLAGIKSELQGIQRLLQDK